MKADKEYWKTLFAHPLAPNDGDVRIIKNHMIKGTTLLLGCTKILIPLSDYQMDIDPWYEADTVIKEDWRENKIFFDNIISDGALNLDTKLTQDILKMAYNCCNRLIVRYFNYKLPKMIVAECFVDPNDMAFIPDAIIKKQEYSFLVWNFNEKNWF